VGRAETLERILGGSTDGVAISLFDGSRVGPTDAPVTIHVRSEKALAYIATAAGDLGLARAYVAGEIDVEGDLYTALKTLATIDFDVPLRERIRVLRELGGFKLLRRPPAPEQEVRLSGRLHSKARDQKAISHHYDVSNKFYEWILGPSMAYTCAVYPSATSTLEEAQFEKFDLVARKLGLRPGMRLLDVGCGWGGMVMHAAGLTELAEVRHLDYRDVAETDFDAISSIGLTEHIGLSQLDSYFRFLVGKMRPGARLLNHCITVPATTDGVKDDWFIRRYVFPDGELTGVGRIVSAMQDRGLEIRHAEDLREHYALTTKAWSENLDAHWDEAVAEVGMGTARVWKLYLAGVSLGFTQNKVQLHQVLGVKLHSSGSADFPLRPDW
jgi:cyclopropane-fatty-acyl-phospholipid synthase